MITYNNRNNNSVQSIMDDSEFKQTLLNCFQHVAYIDQNGQLYYDALEATLYPPANLVSITAYFDQGSAVIYDTDTLDNLKQYLTVTANYDDSTHAQIINYILSGTLTAGTSTIMASYGGKSDTFEVTVTHVVPQYVTDGLVAKWDGIDNTGSGHDSSAIIWTDLVGGYEISVPSANAAWDDNGVVFSGGQNRQVGASTIWSNSNSATYEIVLAPNYSNALQIIAGFEIYSSGVSSRQFAFMSNGTVMFTGNLTNQYSYSDNPISAIHSLSAVYTSGATVYKAYANGIEMTSETAASNVSRRTGSKSILLGNKYDSNSQYAFTGKIMAIRYYNRQLSDAEIAQNHAADVERFNLGA